MAADPAGDRRNHMGKFDVELGGLERAFGLHLGRVGRLQGLAALVDDGIGYGLGLVQGQGAIEFTLGQFGLGAGVRQLAVGLLRHRFERAGVDHVEQIAGFDDGAVAEFDRCHKATDAGANLDLLDRIEPAGEFIPVGHGALHRLRNRNGRRRRGRLLRRLVATRRQRQREQRGQPFEAMMFEAVR
jgi:hypothetical protein